MKLFHDKNAHLFPKLFCIVKKFIVRKFHCKKMYTRRWRSKVETIKTFFPSNRKQRISQNKRADGEGIRLNSCSDQIVTDWYRGYV